ncbi:MAG TPA: phosphohistidine phosphatase SixA [Vicinamibacterales bacterium]|nr:phosphohistidine phosphatase SixA [Vicinamibacterales bacterium]
MAAIYLVRHAIAGERGPKYPNDDLRPLTREGKSRMRAVVAGFRTLEPGLDVILTSPLVRAEGTARILQAGLKGETPMEICEELRPDNDPEDVVVALSRFKKAASVALVGHEPDLGQLAAWLIGAAEPILFKKGGICRIDVTALPPKPPGRLIWHATPKMLRGLA